MREKSKQGYPNLFQALKIRDHLWRKKGRRLRAYQGGDGRYYLTSMDAMTFHRREVQKAIKRECTEENLLGYINHFYNKHGYYPTFEFACQFFNASEELMEAFIGDCPVVMFGTTLVPLAEIEDVYQTYHPQEKVEKVIITEIPVDNKTFEYESLPQWEPITPEPKEEHEMTDRQKTITLNLTIHILLFAAGFCFGRAFF